MSPALLGALTTTPWWVEGRRPGAVELERWLARQRPSIRVEYLAHLLEQVTP